MFRTYFTASLICTLALAGCDADSGPDDAGDDEIATAEKAATADGANGELSYLAAYFTTDARAADIAIAEVTASIEADLEVPACVSVDTDGEAYVELTFSDCVGAGGHLRLDGTLRAEVSVEADAVVYAVTATDFAINLGTVSGSWQIRDAFAAGAASTWSGTTSIVGPIREITTRTEASWTVDGACVTYSYSAEIDRALGTDTAVGQDIERCMDACPRAGSVEVEYALGATLTWTYNGNGTATVVGARGRVFDITLPCAR